MNTAGSKVHLSIISREELLRQKRVLTRSRLQEIHLAHSQLRPVPGVTRLTEALFLRHAPKSLYTALSKLSFLI